MNMQYSKYRINNASNNEIKHIIMIILLKLLNSIIITIITITILLILYYSMICYAIIVYL